MPNRHRLFVSYSHEDKRWFKQVRTQLRVLERAGLVDVFDDTRIQPGEDWHARLNEEMQQAKVGVLLVSASFLNSDFIHAKEIPNLFHKHEQEGMIIYPLLLRPCPWQEVDWLSKIQIRPQGAKALSLYPGPSREQVLAEVAREIAAMLRGANPEVTPNPKKSNAAPGASQAEPEQRGITVASPSSAAPRATSQPSTAAGGHAGPAAFTITLDDDGQFVDPAGVRATLVEALEAFETRRRADIAVVAEPLVRLREELDKQKDAVDLSPAEREELVAKRRRARSIEEVVRDITWCLNAVLRHGARWHVGQPAEASANCLLANWKSF
jgi:hypothetical protein